VKRSLISTVILAAVFAGVQLSGQTSQVGTRSVEKPIEVKMRPNETQDDLIARGKFEAQREIVQEANGVSVNSITTANNGRIVSDRIKAWFKGHLTNLRWTPPEGEFVPANDGIRWKVVLRADVTPPVESTFGVKVETDPRQILIVGELMHINVTTTEDAYVYIFNIFGDGKVTALLPNKMHKDNRVRANVPLQFPSAQEDEQGIRLRATLMENQVDSEEEILVVATKQNIDLIGGDFKEAFIFKDFNPNETGSLDKLEEKLFEASRSGTAEDSVRYQIIRRR
jgi:hypothetical protein